MIEYRIANINEIDEVFEVWKESVKATHDFLKEQDFHEIKLQLRGYLDKVVIEVAYDTELKSILGFANVKDNNLNMLFLHPNSIGKGIGSSLFDYMMEKYDFLSLDVNKDNPKAKEFYLHKGFKVVSESPTDDDGRPYPILHMEKEL